MSRKSGSAEKRAGMRLVSGLGLARRAGRVQIGADAASAALRRGEARALVIAGDAPASVKRKFARLLRSRSVPCNVVLDGQQLGRAVGKSRVVAVAVTDDGLAREVSRLAEAVEG